MDFGKIEKVEFQFINKKNETDIRSFRPDSEFRSLIPFNLKLKEVSKIKSIIDLNIFTDKFYIQVLSEEGPYLNFSIDEDFLKDSVSSPIFLKSINYSNSQFFGENKIYLSDSNVKEINYIEYLIDDDHSYSNLSFKIYSDKSPSSEIFLGQVYSISDRKSKCHLLIKPL